MEIGLLLFWLHYIVLFRHTTHFPCLIDFEGSLPCAQKPANDRYSCHMTPEPNVPNHIFAIHFNIIIFTAGYPKHSVPFRVLGPKYVHL